MVRILGCGCILLGTFGVLAGYFQRLSVAEMQLLNLIWFLGRAEHALGKENRLLFDFLWEEEMRLEESCALRELLCQLQERLKKAKWMSGEECYLAILNERKRQWALKREEMYLVKQIAKGLFGTNKEENQIIFESIRLQLQGMLEQRQKEAGKKKKLWGTTGMLSALMLVLLLW